MIHRKNFRIELDDNYSTDDIGTSVGKDSM